MTVAKQSVPLVFQDAAGNPIANGTVLFRLNVDVSANAASGPQVSAGIVTRATLDSSGACTVALWPNDTTLPANSVYFVEAYTAQGLLAWQGEMTVAGANYLLQEDGTSLFFLEGSLLDAILLE